VEKARECYEKAVELDRKLPVAHRSSSLYHNLGHVYRCLEQFGEACGAFDECKVVENNYANAAECHYRTAANSELLNVKDKARVLEERLVKTRCGLSAKQLAQSAQRVNEAIVREAALAVAKQAAAASASAGGSTASSATPPVQFVSLADLRADHATSSSSSGSSGSETVADGEPKRVLLCTFLYYYRNERDGGSDPNSLLICCDKNSDLFVLTMYGNIDVAHGPNGLIKDITERETLFGIRDPVFREIACKDDKVYLTIK